MPQPIAQNNTSANKSWSFISFFRWCSDAIQKVYSWFTHEKISFPEDESGELMRRDLAQKSWFDSIASGWVEQPFAVKCAIITGVTLSSGLIGLWYSAPLFVMCVTCLITLGINTLLMSHERQRQQRAQTTSQEAIALNKDLKASLETRKGASVVVETVTDRLTQCTGKMESNAEQLGEHVGHIKHQKELLKTRTEELVQATEELVAIEKKAQQQKIASVAILHQFTESVGETARHVDRFGAATSQFSDAVRSIQSSQQSYAEMVAQLGIFVQDQQSKTQDTSNAPNPLMDAFDAELAENELLINEMRNNQGMRTK